MGLSVILSYLPYTLVTAFTPGPNNIVALYAVSQNGWRRGKDVLLGMVSGFLCVMLLCALLCYELVRYIPSVTGVLKGVGAAYIVYLAVHVALSKPDSQAREQMSFWKGFLLEFVNIKIILFAITVYTGYVLPLQSGFGTLLLHAVCLTAIGTAGMVTWAAAGGAFQHLLKRYYRPFNLIMALVLLWCAVSLAFGL